MIKNVYWSSCKVPVIFVRFYWNLNFHDSFEKYSDIKFYENSLFHVTDRHDEADSPFHNFANAPKNR
jgi:hypothetical protein